MFYPRSHVIPKGRVSARHFNGMSSPGDAYSADPGDDVDLWVTTDLRKMIAIWLGLTRVAEMGGEFTLDDAPRMA